MSKLFLFLVFFTAISCEFTPSEEYPLYPNCDCERITDVKGHVDELTGTRISYTLKLKNDCTSRETTRVIDTTEHIDFKVNKCLYQYGF
jgi:hypothetical protein